MDYSPVAQYINSSGKQYALMFSIKGSGNVWLMGNLKSPEMLPEQEIEECNAKDAVLFCKHTGFNPTTRVSRDGMLKGIWVQNSETYGFIPIFETSLSKVDPLFAKLYDSTDYPFVESSPSTMKKYHTEQKVAETLKSLILELYGKIINSQSTTDINILASYIVVDPDNFYSSTGALKSIKDIQFKRDGKLVVPSEDTLHRLLRYASATYYSSPNKVTIPSSTFQFFESIDDFKKRTGQLIFLSQESLQSYRQEQKEEKNMVYPEISKVYTNTQEPFVVCNPRFNNGKPFIIQKVRGNTMEKCEDLGRRWIEAKINEGFDYTPLHSSKPQKVIVYDIRGRIIQGEKTIGRKVNILNFAENKYAVMFYL